MTSFIKILFLTIAISLINISCKKEGPGGKSSVKGIVKHHALNIANAVVYIKYGSKDFPGSDVNSYDTKVTADANGNYEITGLQKGDYYLYSVGYDPFIFQNVYGGLPVTLKKGETKSMDIAVVE